MPTSRLAVLIAGNFFVAVSFMSVSGLLNEIAVSLRISVARAGLLIAAFAITAAVFAPLLATAGSRFDRRRLLTASMAVCAVANIAAALSQTYGQLMAARVLAALTSAVYTPQVAATVSMLVRDHERGPALARLMMGWAIGSVVGGPIIVLVGTSFGWRVSMVLIGVASAIVAVLIGRAVPSGVKVPALNWQRWIRVVRSPALMLLTATTSLNMVGHSLVFSYLAPIMKALHNVSGTTLAGFYFVSGAGGLAGNISSVRLIRLKGATRVAKGAGLMIALSFMIWPLMSYWLAAMFVLQLFWAFGSGAFPAAQQMRLVNVDPSLAAATIAMNSSVTYLGISLGSTFGATAWQVVGPRYIAWVGLVFMLASFGCSYLSERTRTSQPDANGA